MTHTPSPDAPAPGGDPWAAFGYLVAGVLFYGGIGWGVSLWLHAAYWIPIGILVGVAFGLYLVFTRYLFHAPTEADKLPDSSDDPTAARNTRPERNDRGETA